MAAVVLGLCSARLRSLPAAALIQVGFHWVVVLGTALVSFGMHALWRRRYHAAAGDVLLRVLSQPVTERSRRITRWLLTAAVAVDGVFISSAVVPVQTTKNALFFIPQFSQYFFYEGLLWAWCLHHWLANVYWVEFRERGLLTYTGYIPWASMTRISWSPAVANQLVVLERGFFRQLAIDPAARQEVDALLPALQDRLGRTGRAVSRPRGRAASEEADFRRR